MDVSDQAMTLVIRFSPEVEKALILLLKTICWVTVAFAFLAALKLGWNVRNKKATTRLGD